MNINRRQLLGWMATGATGLLIPAIVKPKPIRIGFPSWRFDMQVERIKICSPQMPSTTTPTSTKVAGRCNSELDKWVEVRADQIIKACRFGTSQFAVRDRHH